MGSTAPFVGLFGTLIGVINAFKGIESSHASGLSAVPGGISEALITTPPPLEPGNITKHANLFGFCAYYSVGASEWGK